MGIRFNCQCGQEMQAKDEFAGRKTRCPRCGAELMIPDSTEGKVQSKSESTAARKRELSEADDRVRSNPKNRTRADRWDDDEEEDLEKRTDVPIKSGTSGKAWASLVLGFLSFGCNVLTGIPAIVLAIMSFREIGASRGRLKGQGIAVIGIIVSVIGMLSAGPLLLGFSVYKVRQAAARMSSANNLKQMALAMHNHNDVMGSIPPGNFKAAGPAAPLVANYGNPGLSWRVALLPYLEEDALYRQFHLNEPWDSPHNKTLLTRMPKVYAHPSADAAKTAAGFTHYRAFVGPGTAFDPTVGRNLRMPGDFPDGLSNTLLAVEAADPIEWTRPETADFEYSPTKPLPRLADFTSGGSLAAMGDGSSHLLPKDISEKTLRALITRNGNEIIGPDS